MTKNNNLIKNSLKKIYRLKSKAKASIALAAFILLIILLILGGLYLWKNQSNQNVKNLVYPVLNPGGQVLAFYNSQDSAKEIVPIDGVEANDLPADLVIKPGLYRVYGKIYNLDQEGLYRFLWPIQENQQRIVYSKDVDALMSGIAWIYSHGNEDNEKSFSELKQKALKFKLNGTCGAITQFAQKVLASQKIESRQAIGLTEEKLTGFDDSHVMVEAKVNGSWKLYDLDNNTVFLKQDKFLNYLEFFNSLALNDYQIKKIAQDTPLAVDNFKDKKNGYDYSLYMEEKLYNEISLRDWYKHVIQIPMIKEGSSIYFYHGTEEKAEAFDKKIIKLDEEGFLKKFY